MQDFQVPQTIYQKCNISSVEKNFRKKKNQKLAQQSSPEFMELWLPGCVMRILITWIKFEIKFPQL